MGKLRIISEIVCLIVLLSSAVGIYWYVRVGIHADVRAWIYDINPTGFRLGFQNEGTGKAQLEEIHLNGREMLGYALTPKLPIVIPAGSFNITLTVMRTLLDGYYNVTLIFMKSSTVSVPFEYVSPEEVPG